MLPMHFAPYTWCAIYLFSKLAPFLQHISMWLTFLLHLDCQCFQYIDTNMDINILFHIKLDRSKSLLSTQYTMETCNILTSQTPWSNQFELPDYIHKIIRSYTIHKAPTFAKSGRSHGRQPYPQFYLETLIPRLKPATYHFWWEALVITPRPDLCSQDHYWCLLQYPQFLHKLIKRSKSTYTCHLSLWFSGA